MKSKWVYSFEVDTNTGKVEDYPYVTIPRDGEAMNFAVWLGDGRV